MFAYIPARGGSKRIPRKNIRSLDGKPLLCHVIDALVDSCMLDGIAVSSDDGEILDIARSYKQVTTLESRDKTLANDIAGFSDLVKHDVPRFARYFNSNDFIFVTATAALVDASMYREGIELFNSVRQGLVMAVTEYHPSAMLALAGDPDKNINPLFPEMFTKPTRDLPQTFTDAGCFYVMNLEEAMQVSRFIDMSPVRGVVLPNDIGIDLDTEEDWSRLEKAYKQKFLA